MFREYLGERENSDMYDSGSRKGLDERYSRHNVGNEFGHTSFKTARNISPRREATILLDLSESKTPYGDFFLDLETKSPIAVLIKAEVNNDDDDREDRALQDEIMPEDLETICDSLELAFLDALAKVLSGSRSQILPQQKFAGEVLKLKVSRPHRAPSPPRLQHKVVVSNNITPDHARALDRLRRRAIKESDFKTAKKGSKRRCGECFKFLRPNDVVDERNQNLKRREKKCIECWSNLPPTPANVSNPFKKQYPPLATSLKPPNQWFVRKIPEILVEQHIVRRSVAHLVQEIITSKAIMKDEMREQEYWHPPFWMFELPLLPKHMKFLAQVSLRS